MRDMTTTKRGTTTEEKKREGAFIKRHYLAAKKSDPGLSQESLGGEMGVTQTLDCLVNSPAPSMQQISLLPHTWERNRQH